MLKLFSKLPPVRPETATGNPPPRPAASVTRSAGYDSLIVELLGGQTQSMTRDEFERLPLVERVRLLSSGDLHFYREGTRISSLDALRT